MDGLSLDQIRVMLAVVDHGSFSTAARRLGRAQSAITYAVQRLEEQIGTALFDRSAYRPTLTNAGRALLPRARRIAGEIDAFAAQAGGLTAGVEPELSLAVDSMYPMCALLDAMKAFSAAFPAVPIRVYVESLGSATRLVLDRTCILGLIGSVGEAPHGLKRTAIARVDLIAVAAPSHPLARHDGPIATEALADHVQLVLTDRSEPPGSPDHGVLSTRTWRLGDLGAKHAMLHAGLGWGSMPAHMVGDDLAAGRLVRITPLEWGVGTGQIVMPMWAVCRTDAALGIAARWLLDHIVAAQGQVRRDA